MPNFTRLLSFGIACFTACILGLWVVDTLVSMGLVARVFAPGDFIGNIQDFVALLLAETQIAAVLTIAAFVGAFLLTLLPKPRDFREECVPLLLGGFCGLVVLGRLFSSTAASNPTCAIAGAVCALLVWLGFRFFLKKRAEVAWSFAEVMPHILYAGLVVGFIGNVVIRAVQ